MKKFTFIDLFSGIGGFHIAATDNGGHCVFSSEIDGEAAKTYEVNFNLKPHGDITRIKSDDIPDHDLLCAGFPCQPFSIIGNRMGFDDMRGTLFFEIARILSNKKPPMIILENVKQLATHDNGKTIYRIIECLKEIGYKTYWKILNALEYGLPQKRERTIIVGFLDHSVEYSWPNKIESYIPLEQLLEKEVDKRHYASPMIRKKRKEAHKTNLSVSIWHENKGGNISSHPFSCALRANASYNYLLVNGERRLIPREMLRLQGFPETYKIVCSDSYARKQAGNAVPVPIIRLVIKEILNAQAKVKRLEKKQVFERSFARGFLGSVYP
ncbi:MAG: DNA (cytosine-5-)-methyltransferase [Lentisphaerae bacterium]|nr:DNA (cytosine-5-)-methyltransferase [Lentisphaerota bacterium]